ncbi:PilN domain-containing protein [Dehalobacter sp. DCM]|uniref:PilN domain-containing protein n=1 Tax=Dehalobacter sp. DCM TaxID=2907827 RepID=UPI003081C59A|nr:PilN domain-containing protein [Dehalobacter sp. DCM]
MQQINLFNPYLNKKKLQPNQRIMIGGGIVVALIILSLAFNLIAAMMVRSEIGKQEAYLSSEVVQKDRAALTQAQVDLAKMGTYLTTVNEIAQGLKKSDKLNRSLLDQIAATVPAGLSFQSLAVTEQKSVAIQGTAPSRDTVAELQHNLTQSGLFANVQVVNINRDSGSGSYKFNLEGTLK